MDDHRLIVLNQPRRQTLFWVAFGVLLAFAAHQLWQGYFGKTLGDPVATTLAAFQKQNRLTVFSAQLSPVVAADDVKLLGMLKSRQVAVIPARVDYSLDMSRITRDQLTWDAEKQQMTVILPPLTLSRPDLDEAHAQYLREGVWITSATQARLTHDNSLLAERQAAEAAKNPVLLGLAKSAAKDAVRANLAIPLQVAGYGDVVVNVDFASDLSAPAPAQQNPR